MINEQFDSLTAFCSGDSMAKATTTHTIRINCKEPVEKILVCNVDSSILSYECITGQATVSGKNNVKLVYVDAENNILSCNSVADFSDILIHDSMLHSSKLSMDTIVVDCKTDILGNIVTVQVLLETLATVYTPHTVPCIEQCPTLLHKSQDIELLSYVDCVNVVGEVSSQFTATSNITRVILADSKVSVLDYAINDGVLTVNGDMTVSLMYLTDDTLVYDTVTAPYRTELECKAHSGQLIVKPCVRNTRIKLDIMEEEFNNVFTAEIGVAFEVLSLTYDNISIIQDCYSKTCLVEHELSQLPTTIACGSASCTKSIEQTISDYDNASGCVALVNVGCKVTSAQCTDGGVVVEGLVCATALLYGEGYTSSYVELPFMEVVTLDYMTNGCKASVHGVISSCSYKGVGNTLTVNADIRMDIFSYKNVTIHTISNITESEIDTSSMSAIEVCLAQKGDTLWDIAKALRMSEDDILAVNPDIVSPLESDAKVVIYNKL